ncbi:MAG TPA: PAS domain S-box protein [Syntrophales bacterium]|nr:PAS domain S-box protein [Syntrophales bacterium]
MSDKTAIHRVVEHVEKLQWQRKIVADIIDYSPIPQFAIDKNHRVIFWNRACEELTGYAASEMVGTDKHYLPFYGVKRPLICDLIVDNDVKGLEKYYGSKRVRRTDRGRGGYEVRDFFLNLNGRSRHLYFLAAPIYDEKGEIIGAVETLQDITREREIELSLKEHAETLQAELEKNLILQRTIEGIIEGSPVPMFVIDREHKILYWNKAMAELTGCSAKSMIGTDNHWMPFYPGERRPLIADLIVEDDVEGLSKYYVRSPAQKSPLIEGAYEVWDYFENLGGRARYLHFQAAPIRDDRGEIIAAVETLEDITREEEMARNLREYAESLQNELSENIRLRTEIEGVYRYLQSILDSSPDILIELSKEGYITFVSRDEAEVLGEAKLVGKHFTEFIPSLKTLLTNRWAEVEKGNFQPYEIDVETKGGEKRTFLITPRPIEERERYLLVMRDITEFKELERKYYETEKLAALGQLSAGIAHEIRNPLSSIKMSLQILEKRLKPEGNDLKRFKIAQREVEHLEELVNDVLIFARPMEPKKRTSQVRRLIENALEMAEKIISDKGIEVETRLAEDVPDLFVDPHMIEQALLNLIRNAVGAMERGGHLVIVARRAEKGLPAVVLEVIDNGCGMDEDQIPHIFNPFYTLKKQGTGLGMSQVKKIIDLHRGTVEVKSKKGEGTQITVYLPLTEGEALVDVR